MRPTLVFLLLFAALLQGCASQVSDVKINQRDAIVDVDEAGLWAQMTKFEKLLANAPERERDLVLQKYVDDLTCQLAEDLCRDIRVYIVRQPYFNAFMTPNGMMVLYTGLLLRMEDEAQLVTVIGHEIAHYRKRHSLENWRRAKSTANWLTFIAVLGQGTGVGFVATLGAYANFSAFSRAQEQEADVLGFQSMVRLGYQGHASAEIWRNAMEEEKLEPRPFLSGIFASHPAPPKREANLALLANAPEAQKSVLRNQERFAEIILPLRAGWLDDELSRRSFRQSELMLNRLGKLPFGGLQTQLAKAELFRKRDQVGDLERAIVAYQNVTLHPEAPAIAFRDLGLSLRKAKRNAEAKAAFQEYLNRLPNATDTAMIRSYLNAP